MPGDLASISAEFWILDLNSQTVVLMTLGVNIS